MNQHRSPHRCIDDEANLTVHVCDVTVTRGGIQRTGGGWCDLMWRRIFGRWCFVLYMHSLHFSHLSYLRSESTECIGCLSLYPVTVRMVASRRLDGRYCASIDGVPFAFCIPRCEKEYHARMLLHTRAVLMPFHAVSILCAT